MESFGLVSLPGTLLYCLSKIQGLKTFGQFRTAVNSVTVTLHPVVPNPCKLLDLIPAKAKIFTCLDPKDAFFCICLAPQRQPIFAFQLEIRDN
jgi:hypothetical protein